MCIKTSRVLSFSPFKSFKVRKSPLFQDINTARQTQVKAWPTIDFPLHLNPGTGKKVSSVFSVLLWSKPFSLTLKVMIWTKPNNNLIDIVSQTRHNNLLSTWTMSMEYKYNVLGWVWSSEYCFFLQLLLLCIKEQAFLE